MNTLGGYSWPCKTEFQLTGKLKFIYIFTHSYLTMENSLSSIIFSLLFATNADQYTQYMTELVEISVNVFLAVFTEKFKNKNRFLNYVKRRVMSTLCMNMLGRYSCPCKARLQLKHNYLMPTHFV